MSEEGKVVYEIHPPEAAERAAALEARTRLEPAAVRGGTTGGAPLELAHAFRAQAEALDRLGAMQAELGKALARNDRSELMLQSTAALNESFRNMAAIQRELLARLAAPPPRRGSSRTVALVSLGFLVVLVGGIAALVEAIRQGRTGAAPVDPAAIAQEIAAAHESGRTAAESARNDEWTRLAEERDAAREHAGELATRLEAQFGELAELERKRRLDEAENERLRADVARGQQAVVEREHFSREVERLQQAEDARDAERARLQRELDAAREERLALVQRLADWRLGLPPEDGAGLVPLDPAPFVPNVRVAAPPESAAREPAAQEPAAPEAPRVVGPVPPPVVRRASSAPDEAPPATLPPPPAGGAEERDVERVRLVRDRVNDLLARARGAGRGSYSLLDVGAVGADRLVDAVLVRYDPEGRADDLFRARDMRIETDPREGTVRLVLLGGTREADGRRRDLPPEGLALVVARGEELLSAWYGSGLAILRSR